MRSDTSATPARGDQKVVVVGLSKTGTSTLKDMLTALGYRVCGPRKNLIKDARAGNMSVLDPVLESYDAFEDWPWPLAYKHAFERYGSRAKFILTTRKSPAVWFRSIENHGMGTSPFKSMHLAYGRYRPFGREEEFTRQYEQHNAEVRAFFAAYPDQFLEFCLEKGDGWDKLCKFLGHPVPDRSVPHANKTTGSAKRLDRFINQYLIAPIYRRLP